MSSDFGNSPSLLTDNQDSDRIMSMLYTTVDWEHIDMDCL